MRPGVAAESTARPMAAAHEVVDRVAGGGLVGRRRRARRVGAGLVDHRAERDDPASGVGGDLGQVRARRR